MCTVKKIHAPSSVIFRSGPSIDLQKSSSIHFRSRLQYTSEVVFSRHIKRDSYRNGQRVGKSPALHFTPTGAKWVKGHWLTMHRRCAYLCIHSTRITAGSRYEPSRTGVSGP